MIEINPDDIIGEFMKRGISRIEGAKRLLPYYKDRNDAGRFKRYAEPDR